MSCPTSANYSFPIGLGFTPSASTYTAVTTNTFSIEFNWGPSVTPPIFKSASSCSVNQSGSKSTLRYKGLNYTLIQTEVTAPTHNNWLIQPVKANNSADLILTFSTPDTTATAKYIFVVIPLAQISSDPKTDPLYLRALANSSITGNFSLGDCLPSTQSFAVYKTCMNPTQDTAICLLFYTSRTVSSTTLAALTRCNGAPTLPVGLQSNTPLNMAQTAFNSTVQVSTLTLQEANPTQRIENTASYTCVPFDPDTQVKDGKIYIDTATGTIQKLNDITQARDVERKNTNKVGIISPGQLELYISYAITALIGLLILYGIGYSVAYSNTPINAIPDWVKDTPVHVLIACLFTFIGFLVGLFTGPALS
jgi:hypothetical protein